MSSRQMTVTHFLKSLLKHSKWEETKTDLGRPSEVKEHRGLLWAGKISNETLLIRFHVQSLVIEISTGENGFQDTVLKTIFLFRGTLKKKKKNRYKKIRILIDAKVKTRTLRLLIIEKQHEKVHRGSNR